LSLIIFTSRKRRRWAREDGIREVKPQYGELLQFQNMNTTPCLIQNVQEFLQKSTASLFIVEIEESSKLCIQGSMNQQSRGWGARGQRKV
jgi:hypothetical protein